MFFKKFIKKINWRLLLIHFSATLLIATAFHTFSLLYNPDLLRELRANTGPVEEVLKKRTAEEVTYFAVIPIYASLLGMLISFFISLGLSIHYRWFWLNSFLILILCRFANGLEIVPKYVNYLFALLNSIPGALSMIITKGSVILFLGLALFFSPRLIRFIKGNQPHEHDDQSESIEPLIKSIQKP